MPDNREITVHSALFKISLSCYCFLKGCRKSLFLFPLFQQLIKEEGGNPFAVPWTFPSSVTH